MRQSYLVTFDLEEKRCKGSADDLRGNILDSLGFPDWLEAPGALMVVKLGDDHLLHGPPLDGVEVLARLERRMGSMKLVGERDDLLLDAAIFIARCLHDRTTC